MPGVGSGRPGRDRGPRRRVPPPWRGDPGQQPPRDGRHAGRRGPRRDVGVAVRPSRRVRAAAHRRRDR
ncbi:MAG: hypothetical protein FJX74_18350 [Armatimonadetes bacterium]|nr:hypothetical protein [Armatimonadota bacterium]